MLMVNQLAGFGGGLSVPPPELTFIESLEDQGAGPTYTFAGRSFGAEDPTRRIVCVLNWDDSTTGATLNNSVTIGGIAATIHRQSSGAGLTGTAIVSALVPTGTTGTVAFTCSGAQDRAQLAIFRAVNETSSTPHDHDFDAAVTSGLLTTAIDVPANGWVVAGLDIRGPTGVTFTWTGANIAYQAVYGDAAAVFRSGAFQSGLAAQSGRTISAQSSNTGAANGSLVAMSWG